MLYAEEGHFCGYFFRCGDMLWSHKNDAKNIDMCTSSGETKFPQPHPFGSQFVAPPSWPSGAFGAAVPAMGWY